MSKPARWITLVVGVAVVVMEIVAYFVYRDAIDGVFANLAIAIYGLFALVAVWVIDRLVRYLHRRGVERPA
jgi:membrane protein YdbS with pleckstrin-like domain